MNLGNALRFSGCLGRLTSPNSVVITNDETSEMKSKLVMALQSKREEYRNKFKQEMSFTRVLLKLGTVRTFMNDIRRVFNERDMDHSGHIDLSEMFAAMKDLKVNLSEEEVKTMFKMADFYEDDQLTMKQFLVVLAMGYVLNAIPDLLERSSSVTETTVTTTSRRMSHFHNKEDTVRNALALFTYAYLLFDVDCKGFISRKQVMEIVAEQGQKDIGSMSILSQERWDEMDWDSNGRISFGEFVYTFIMWVDVDGEETIDELAMKKEAGSKRERSAKRKSSPSVVRKTSVIAQEISRRLAWALSPKPKSSAIDGSSNNNSTRNEPEAGSSSKEAAGDAGVLVPSPTSSQKALPPALARAQVSWFSRSPPRWLPQPPSFADSRYRFLNAEYKADLRWISGWFCSTSVPV